MKIESDIERHSWYFFFTCFIIIAIASLFLIKSFVITIISAMLLSYIFYPLYLKILNLVRNKNIASILTIILIIAIIFIPLIFAANALINESVQIFHKAKNVEFSNINQKISSYFGDDINVDEYFSKSLDTNFNDYIINLLNKFSLSIARSTSDFIVSLPAKILHFFVMIFLIFFLLKEGKLLFERIKEHIPLKEAYRRDLANKFSNVIYAILYGIVTTAFIQGALGVLGFWIFNVPSPILWGLVMVILAMLPFIGAYIVWLPVSLYKIFTGEIFNGVGLLLYGIFIISTIDNIVKPAIIGTKGKIHPTLVLLGVFGGLEVFGLLGIILGPLILAILTVFLDLYILEKKEKIEAQ